MVILDLPSDDRMAALHLVETKVRCLMPLLAQTYKLVLPGGHEVGYLPEIR